MYFYIGIVVILFSISFGYLGEGGNISIMLQPFALLIILGTAIGVFLVSYPKRLLIAILESLFASRKQALYSKESYTELLVF